MNDHIKASLMMGKILGIVALICAGFAGFAWLIADHLVLFQLSVLGLIVMGGLVVLYRSCLADVRGEHTTFYD